MSETPQPNAPATPPPRRRTALIVILVLFVVLTVAGAGAGYWFWWRPSHQANAAAKPAPQGAAIVPLEPFLVNLADKEASRFLRINVRLVVDEEHEAEAIEKDPVRLTRARSAILEILTTQESAALVTPEGKAALRRALAERSSAVLNLEVRDVLFTDFVVQF